MQRTTLSALFLCAGILASQQSIAAIRVVTYNTSVSGAGIIPPKAGFDTLMKAIGDHHLVGNAQPIDVLGLQELDGTQSVVGLNSATLPYVVSQLNAIYGSGTYAADTVKDPTTGGTGGGPNGLVYNTHTIQVIEAKVIGTVSGSGIARAPMRYKLRPVGRGADADFYFYVVHYKASSDSTSKNRRNIESTTIRADADALGASAHIIYAGDFNVTSGRAESAWTTLVAPGPSQAVDSMNPAGNWTNTSTFRALMTESATTTDIRFDFQLVTAPVLAQRGVQLVPGSMETFGNNGSHAFATSVTSASNTALADLVNRSSILSLLITVSDHLPVVADYVYVGPACPADLNADTFVDDADFVLFAAAYDGLVCPVAPAPCPADLNGDTFVDDSDFVQFATAYNALVCP